MAQGHSGFGPDTITNDLWTDAYGDLRRLAAHRIARLTWKTSLHPTLLVNEAYLRLRTQEHPRWNSRTHFVAIVAQAIRFAATDHIRRRLRLKRRRDHTGSMPSQATIEVTGRGVELLDLDRALSTLETTHPRPAEIVSLKFFGGLTIPEISKELGVSTATVERDWRFARAWLHRALSKGDTPAPNR